MKLKIQVVLNNMNIMGFILMSFMFLFGCNQTDSKNFFDNSRYNNEELQLSQDSIKDVSCGEYVFSLKSMHFKKGSSPIKSYPYDLIYYDNSANILFLVNEIEEKSISVLDVCNGIELLSMNINYIEFKGVYKMSSNRYFIKVTCESCDLPEIWEFDFDLERMDVVDIPIQDLIKVNML